MKVIRFHPGETVVMNFTVPFSVYDIKAVALSVRDQNSVVFETLATSFKQVSEFVSRVGYTLTQEESLQFEEYHHYRLQLNVFGPNGSRIVSKELDVETGAQQLPEPGFSEINSLSYAGMSSGSTGKNALSYNDLIDKPKINSQILAGNRILPENRITEKQIDAILFGEEETENPVDNPEENPDNSVDNQSDNNDTSDNTNDNTDNETNPST